MIDEIYDGLTLLPRNYDSRNINSNIRIKFIRGNNWLGSLIFVKIVIINTKLFRRTYVLSTKKIRYIEDTKYSFFFFFFSHFLIRKQQQN